jgi:hypothetical protein
MPKAETIITEIEEFEPSRVDGVGKGANGFPILMLKGIEAEVEVVKADDERKKCSTCDGSGKIMDGHRDCPDCKGFGKSPKVGETAKQYFEAMKESGVAPSTAPAELTEQDCPTCKGSGTIRDNTHDGKMCPDCGGTGIDQTMTNAKELSAVDADTGKISVGDPEGRERIDKSDGCPGCAVAMDNGDKECATCGTKVEKGNDADGFRPADYKPDADETVECPKCERMNSMDAAFCDQCGHELMGDHHVTVDGVSLDEDDDTKTAEKAMDPIIAPDATVFSAPNPMLAADEAEEADPYPGSPAWETVDAATATAAATALMTAAELIRKFGQRESIEVAAGEGNDLYDATTSEAALMGVTHALGIMAQMAFHEGIEARKSADETVEKAGKRISGKSITALAAARDHLNMVLGEDDPAKKDKEYDRGDSASAIDVESVDKALLTKEIEDMSTDELEKVLNARDERLVEVLSGVLKGEVSEEEAPSVDTEEATDEITKESKKSDDEEAEVAKSDVACKGCGEMCKADDINCMKCGMAMKAELTEDEIEAKLARKEAKKALKAAEKAEKEAAENAAVQKAIAEGVAEATAAVIALQERLSTVEKMAAPSTIVRTRPQDAFAKSTERDELDMRIAHLERVARETPDQDIRKAAREEAKELRDQMSSLSA